MICRICGRDLEIPKSAILLRQRSGNALYQFQEDHQVHVFRIAKHGAVRSAHTRWHQDRGIKKQGCKFCFPESEPGPIQVPGSIEQEVVTILAELPQPQQPEIPAPEPLLEPDQDQPSETAMSHAFGQIKRFKQ